MKGRKEANTDQAGRKTQGQGSQDNQERGGDQWTERGGARPQGEDERQSVPARVLAQRGGGGLPPEISRMPAAACNAQVGFFLFF